MIGKIWKFKKKISIRLELTELRTCKFRTNFKGHTFLRSKSFKSKLQDIIFQDLKSKSKVMETYFIKKIT